MNSGALPYVIGGGAFLLVGFALWLATSEARRRGRAEAEAEHNERMAKNAEAMGKVMVEHRDPADTASRLDTGKF